MLVGCALDARITVELCADLERTGELAERLAPLLRAGDDRRDAEAATRPDAEVLRLAVEHDGIWRLRVDADTAWDFGDIDELADGLLAVVNQHVIACGQQRQTLLHAAGVVLEGRPVLLVAPSGSGKSTLAAGLVARGADYLSDEAVGVLPSDLRLRGYTKPISLKPGSARHLRGVSVRLRDWAGSPVVDPADWGARALPTAEPPALVVLPRYEPGARCHSVRLPPAAAVLALAQCSFGFRKHGERDLRTLARLARSTPVVQLVHSDLRQAVLLLTKAARGGATGGVAEVTQTSQERVVLPP